MRNSDFGEGVVILLIDFVAVAVAVFEDEVAVLPEAADAFHAIGFVGVHQALGEEAGEVADATNDDAAEKCLGIAHFQHFEQGSLIFILLHSIDMHGEGVLADLDFPLVALGGTEVVEDGKVLKSGVPPIDFVVFFVEIFSGDNVIFVMYVITTFVVKGIVADDDFDIFMVNGGIGHVFKVLVGDGAVVVENLVVPFGAHELAVLLEVAVLPVLAPGLAIGFHKAARGDHLFLEGRVGEGGEAALGGNGVVADEGQFHASDFCFLEGAFGELGDRLAQLHFV